MFRGFFTSPANVCKSSKPHYLASDEWALQRISWRTKKGIGQIGKQNKLIFNYESVIRIVREDFPSSVSPFNSANFRIKILGLDFTHVFLSHI